MYLIFVLFSTWLNHVCGQAVSPVFIQHLSTGDVTFPTKHCNRCRGDKRDICLSSKVTCSNDSLAEELIWSNNRCEGPPSRRVSLPLTFVSCPGPDHYSPWNIDLDRFNLKLQHDFPDLFPNNKTAAVAIVEYRKMLVLNQIYPDTPVVPSKLVDQVWHTHILDTIQYHRDCLRMFGKYFHHAPSFGGEEEKTELREDQTVMLQKYEEHFNTPPRGDVWPLANQLRGKLPDCCKAYCVKYNCRDCVGCGPIDCGYPKLKTKIHLSPATFGGYVPIDVQTLETSQISSKLKWNKVSPYSFMDFQWTIEEDTIKFSHSVKDKNVWYGMGICAPKHNEGLGDGGGMGFADYMISMYNRNYTGVFDLYKYDKGSGYPCWDVLYECSVGNKTKGTKDVQNSAITRENGITTSTWLRKLNTGDSKDWPITQSNMKIMFAYGRDDWFTEHRSARTCTINFYTGKSKCGDDGKNAFSIV